LRGARCDPATLPWEHGVLGADGFGEADTGRDLLFKGSLSGCRGLSLKFQLWLRVVSELLSHSQSGKRVWLRLNSPTATSCFIVVRSGPLSGL